MLILHYSHLNPAFGKNFLDYRVHMLVLLVQARVIEVAKRCKWAVSALAESNDGTFCRCRFNFKYSCLSILAILSSTLILQQQQLLLQQLLQQGSNSSSSSNFGCHEWPNTIKLLNFQSGQMGQTTWLLSSPATNLGLHLEH